MSRTHYRSSTLAIAGILALLGLGITGPLACGGDDTETSSTGSPSGPGGSGPTSSSTGMATSTATTGSTGGGGSSSTASVGGGGSSSSTTASVGGAGGMGGIGGAGGASVSSTGVGGQANCINPPDDCDGDGWTIGQGDCCDSTADGCAKPVLVNPGAFEYLGNAVDDDCDPSSSDTVAVPDCGGNPLMTPTSSTELIKAMDLCQFITGMEPVGPTKKWGVILTELLQADGTAVAPKDVQVGVLDNYGPNVLPKKGGTMASLSSGTARDESDPNYVHPQNGTMGMQTGNYNANTQAGVPPTWLAANGGALPPTPACPGVPCSGPGCLIAYDSVNFKAKIRVPTNALSFSYNFKFYSAEYPEYLCQQYNDFFLTLLTSSYQACPPAMVGDPCIPVDHNIAFDSAKNPVSVNNGFFDVCFPYPAAPVGSCPAGTVAAVGTGMGGWNGNLKDGGGTVWLINDAPVTPGEDITIEFIIWDAGDHNVDSAVLLDKFRWNIDPSPVGTHT